jgi:hypothetical protein
VLPAAGRRGWHTGGHVVLAVCATDDHCGRPCVPWGPAEDRVARSGAGSGRENYSDSGQTVLELLNRFGADGWELAGLQDYREGGDGTSYWEAARLLTVYTFKRPVPA